MSPIFLAVANRRNVLRCDGKPFFHRVLNSAIEHEGDERSNSIGDGPVNDSVNLFHVHERVYFANLRFPLLEIEHVSHTSS